MAINEGDPILDPGLFTGYRTGIARDIIFPGTRDLYNTDTLFDAQAYANRQIVPPDQVLAQQPDESPTIYEPGPAADQFNPVDNPGGNVIRNVPPTDTPKVSGASLVVLGIITLLVLRK